MTDSATRVIIRSMGDEFWIGFAAGALSLIGVLWLGGWAIVRWLDDEIA